MSDEQGMKRALQAYIDHFNASNPQAISALFADEATVEDPVGTPLISGRTAIAAFYERSVATGARLKLAAPIRGSHGNAAAMAFDVELNMPQGPALIRVIDTFTFDAAGKFTSMRAFWGPGDMELPK
ncbi:steroid Delta-isomerase [Hydrocarboniphaga sp.]|uniref:steroid Delta-isomerase n=1 Tax=Hydrocarboniphaga sp. TaxID=2033016 RepID=UPI003D139F6B